MVTIQQYSVEDSCKELLAWIERLRKLDEYDEKDLRAYFSRNNVWVENPETVGSFMVDGAESYVYKGYDEKEVFKFKRCRTDSIRELATILGGVLNHNKCFPDTYYTLIGFSSYERDVLGTIRFGVVLRQEFVKGEFATHEQILTHLKKEGFTLLRTDADGHILALKNGFQVTDLKSANAIVANNRVYIIDCCVVKYE